MQYLEENKKKNHGLFNDIIYQAFDWCLQLIRDLTLWIINKNGFIRYTITFVSFDFRNYWFQTDSKMIMKNQDSSFCKVFVVGEPNKRLKWIFIKTYLAETSHVYSNFCLRAYRCETRALLTIDCNLPQVYKILLYLEPSSHEIGWP